MDTKRIYIVTNRCWGDLSSRWVSKGRIPTVEYVQTVSIQLLKAVECLQNHRFVHRDIKPANVFLKSSAHESDICLGDFGMVTAVPSDDEPSSCSVAGSPAFFAPEVWISNKQYMSSDCWSVGITILSLFAGDHPIQIEDYMWAVPDYILDPNQSARSLMHKLLVSKDKLRKKIATALIHKFANQSEKFVTLALVGLIVSNQEVITNVCMLHALPLGVQCMAFFSEILGIKRTRGLASKHLNHPWLTEPQQPTQEATSPRSVRSRRLSGVPSLSPSGGMNDSHLSPHTINCAGFAQSSSSYDGESLQVGSEPEVMIPYTGGLPVVTAVPGAIQSPQRAYATPQGTEGIEIMPPRLPTLLAGSMSIDFAIAAEVKPQAPDRHIDRLVRRKMRRGMISGVAEMNKPEVPARTQRTTYTT